MFKDTNKGKTFTEADNIMLNLMSGLKPKELTKREIEILENEIGEDWFEKLGFAQLGLEKPVKKI